MGTMDGIIDTVSAVHPLMPLLFLLKAQGKMIMVGAPDKPLELPAFSLIMGRWSADSRMCCKIAGLFVCFSCWPFDEMNCVDLPIYRWENCGGELHWRIEGYPGDGGLRCKAQRNGRDRARRCGLREQGNGATCQGRCQISIRH